MMENGAPLREGGRTMGEEMGEGEQEMMSKRCFDVRQDYGLEKKIITSFAQEGEETYIFGVDLSPSSNRCVTHDSNGKICVWDTSSLQVICEVSFLSFFLFFSSFLSLSFPFLFFSFLFFSFLFFSFLSFLSLFLHSNESTLSDVRP